MAGFLGFLIFGCPLIYWSYHNGRKGLLNEFYTALNNRDKIEIDGEWFYIEEKK